MLSPTIGSSVITGLRQDAPVSGSPVLASLRLEFGLQDGHLGLEFEHPPDAGEGEPVRGEIGDPLDSGDVRAAVATLAAGGATRPYDVFGVEPAQERRLESEHARHLSHAVDRSVLVVDRQAHETILSELVGAARSPEQPRSMSGLDACGTRR